MKTSLFYLSDDMMIYSSPGVFTLNDSLTLEYVPTAQNKQFCASWKLKLETNATFPSLPSSLLSQMGLGNGSQKCFFNFPFLLMKQVWTQWTLRKSFPCSLWTRICFSKPLDGEALVGGAGMFISGRRSPWKGARGLKGAYSQSTKYNPTEESWLEQPRFTHQGEKLQKIKLTIFPRIENGSPNKDVVRVPVVQQDRLCCRGEDGRGLSMAQGLL